MSKQPPPLPPPAPTASAIGPCPTVIQIVGCPGTGSLPCTIAPPDHHSRRDDTLTGKNLLPSREQILSCKSTIQSFDRKWLPVESRLSYSFHYMITVL